MHANVDQKKAAMTTLISEKTNLKQEILPDMSKISFLMPNVNLSIDSLIPIQNLSGFFLSKLTAYSKF